MSNNKNILIISNIRNKNRKNNELIYYFIIEKRKKNYFINYNFMYNINLTGT